MSVSEAKAAYEESNISTTYSAEIVRTSFGVAHITAKDFASLGYGEGYAAAEDHICNIAYATLSASGQRALYLGVGEGNKHVYHDAVVQALGIADLAEKSYQTLDEERLSWFQGYADGFNRYLKARGPSSATWCHDADWVRPISPRDLLARGHMMGQAAPMLTRMIATAQPPTSKEMSQQQQLIESEGLSVAAELEEMKSAGLGSNAWAIGAERSENGKGLLLANPHYPWTGFNRFWEKHLVIPGKLDVYGVNLTGLPGVGIGFNKDVGWSHTVSDSERLTFYSLNLVAGEPTKYHYDDQVRDMTRKDIEVSVKQADGTIELQSLPIWFSHYGPMLNMPKIGWSNKLAISMRDANVGNTNYLFQWRDMSMADSMGSFIAAHHKWNSMPWVNTIAVSKEGIAQYIDGSSTGRLSEEAIQNWREEMAANPLSAQFWQGQGSVLLDGSNSQNEWVSHSESRYTGVTPHAEKPSIARQGYVFNANDSYWLSSPENPLTGYSPLYGKTESPRQLRTRMNALLLDTNSEFSAAGNDGRFSIKDIQNALFDNRSLAAELLAQDLIDACTGNSTTTVDGQIVDLKQACDILKNFDKKFNLDNPGSVLFREWLHTYNYKELFDKGLAFDYAFDADDPVNTPHSLSDKSLALEKLGRAILILQRAGLDLDSSLRGNQISNRPGDDTPVHGAGRREGIANLMMVRRQDWGAPQTRGKLVEGSSRLTDKGYIVTHGTSFVMTLNYTEEGPQAEAILGYGQSGDLGSPHCADQTKLYSEKKWRPILFKDEDIRANILSTTLLEN